MTRRLGLAAAVVALALALATATCGGDDAAGDDTDASGLGGPSPNLQGPASRYAPYLNELRGEFEANPSGTYGFTEQLYAGSGPFHSAAEAAQLIGDWGYVDGYQATYEPVGLLAAAVQGRFFVTTETHLFKTTDGARKAFDTYAAYYAAATGSVAVADAQGLANQSAAFKIESGTLGNSTVNAVFHSFMFRRGNLVAIVRTFGGVPFMTIEQARAVAVIMDEHALGKRVNDEPTPDTRGGPPTPVGKN
ncbi:MAG: hypothetical protein HY875_12790 [Chloroflexi bacterium]|nr:hypothetical protein [Chloroflexota bacterium]